MEKKRILIDWNAPVQIGVVVAILVGANLPIYMHSKNEMKMIEAEMKEFKALMHAETKDFHGRLTEIEVKKEISG